MAERYFTGKMYIAHAFGTILSKWEINPEDMSRMKPDLTSRGSNTAWLKSIRSVSPTPQSSE